MPLQRDYGMLTSFMVGALLHHPSLLILFVSSSNSISPFHSSLLFLFYFIYYKPSTPVRAAVDSITIKSRTNQFKQFIHFAHTHYNCRVFKVSSRFEKVTIILMYLGWFVRKIWLFLKHSLKSTSLPPFSY